MEVEPQPSYSWWWNSHNKPRQSAWLQTTLADLDNKTKAMLSLIQEEADSFAKRADMYYTRRPELINLIEQFYRAHRSLAERYDHLKGETKQNAQKAVQFQFQDALSYDGFLKPPFAKDQIVANESVNQGLQEEISMHDSTESDSEISEVDNPEPQVYKIKNEENSDQDNESVSASDSEVDNPVDEAAETVNINSRLREMESRISYLEDENSRLLRRLTMKSLKSKHLKEKIRRLKKEKSFFKEELFFVDREKSLLQRESDIVKAEYSKLRNENEAGLQQRQVLTRKVGNLHKKNQRLSEQNKVMSTVLGFVNGQATSMARSNVILRNEIQQGNQEAEAIIQSLKDEKKNAEIMFEAEGKLVSEQNAKIEELQSEVRILAEQNREQQGNQEAEAIIQSLKDEKKNAEIMFEAEGKLVSEQNAKIEELQTEVRILAEQNREQQGNQEAEAIIQSLKDEKKNAEIMFEAEGKLVSEQNAKIEELQSEVRVLAEQNREQDIQLLERNEEKREVIRQLSFALEVLRDKNQRLEEALRNSRAGALCKVNTHDSASSQFSTWKKFLAAAWWGGPQPQNHIPARRNFGSLSLNLSEKHTTKVLSLRE